MDELNANALSNLIQNISEKMYNNKDDLIKETEEKKEEEQEKNTETNNSLSDIISMFTKDNTNNSEGLGIDVNTIFKIQKLIGNINKEDPRKNLLLSLKPFLRKSRQEKINEYITYLTIGSALRNI